MAKLTPRQKLIKAEMERLKAIFSQLPDNQYNLAEKLIEHMAELHILLKECEADIDDKGYTEMFCQSSNAEPYERKRPVVEIYLTGYKNYQATEKQLKELLPVDKGGGDDDEFNTF